MFYKTKTEFLFLHKKFHKMFNSSLPQSKTICKNPHYLPYDHPLIEPPLTRPSWLNKEELAFLTGCNMAALWWRRCQWAALKTSRVSLTIIFNHLNKTKNVGSTNANTWSNDKNKTIKTLKVKQFVTHEHNLQREIGNDWGPSPWALPENNKFLSQHHVCKGNI